MRQRWGAHTLLVGSSPGKTPGKLPGACLAKLRVPAVWWHRSPLQKQSQKYAQESRQ